MATARFECEIQRSPSFLPNFGEVLLRGAHETLGHGCGRKMTDVDIAPCAKRLLII
jgi:hypothetical protein